LFRLKICGVRLKSDLDVVEASGGDAVGFNFFPPSVRFLDPQSESTRGLLQYASQRKLLRVGVFVNEPTSSLIQKARELGLQAVQLHGDERPEVALELLSQEMQVIRAIKLPRGVLDSQQIEEATKIWLDAGVHLLLDADGGSQHGGTGSTLDWRVLGQWSRANPQVSWTLAGGLTVENVVAAIDSSSASSVDVASGVEEPRGQKSPHLIRQFSDLALGRMDLRGHEPKS